MWMLTGDPDHVLDVLHDLLGVSGGALGLLLKNSHLCSMWGLSSNFGLPHLVIKIQKQFKVF